MPSWKIKTSPGSKLARTSPACEQDFLELRFWAKSADVKTVTMRLVDKLGHNYQQRFPIDPDGQWHSFTVKEFNKGQAWGGPPDGKWVGPPQSITFVLESHGTLWIDGIEALLDPQRLAEFFLARPKVLGNVFIVGQPVEIPVETRAARLECDVLDFWGKTVCRCTSVAKENLAVLKPDIKSQGHFTARVRFSARGRRGADRGTRDRLRRGRTARTGATQGLAIRCDDAFLRGLGHVDRAAHCPCRRR